MMLFKRYKNVLMTGVILTLITPVTMSEAATKTIISCSTDRYAIEIKRDTSRNKYIYIAYDLSVSNSQPSLILRNGKVRDSHIATLYTFKNGRYSYTVARKFEGRGGEIFLSIDESAKQIFSQQCH